MSKEIQNKVLTRSAYVRNTSAEMLENRQVEFVISSEAVDSYGTVFKMDGWDLTRYQKNPIVCYQHRSHSNDPDDLIGTSEVFRDGDLLIGRVTFEDADTNPKAEKVFKKIKAGTLKMASVGAIIGEADFGDETRGEDPNILYFTKQELFEWSIVSVGANPDAHKRNAQTIDEIREGLKPGAKNTKPADSSTTKEERTVQQAQLIVNKNKYLK